MSNIRHVRVCRTAIVVSMVLALAGCASVFTDDTASESIQAEMQQASQEQQVVADEQLVNQALLPPLSVPVPQVPKVIPRFDLSIHDASAKQVFMAVVSGTSYSMLVHPDVDGRLSLNLKDVTVLEALEAIRELYGYDYQIHGQRIFIQPITMQTRIFHVNYLTGQRDGKSALRVISGSVSDSAGSSSGEGSTSFGGTSSKGVNSSQVSMTSHTDFWLEVETSLKAIVGAVDGRSVVVSPMTGVIVVRAMPDELRHVAAYLKASQLSVQRQVILEAKIIEVQLSDGFQSGVNWAGFARNAGQGLSAGVADVGNTLAASTAAGTQAISNAALNANPGATLATTAVPNAAIAGSLFGLAFQTGNFAALLNFLESQGTVHVLSSPRIATLNNQKAVLKVGTDEFFVTNVSTTTTVGTATTSTPNVTLQPFFTGIALDVTPRIDDEKRIILHVHPSVSQVNTVNKTVSVGGTGGTLNLPLASSSISETDSIVQARDGQIVAIGGLMRQASFSDESGLPGLPKSIFGQQSKRVEKRELVILIKPTVVDNDKDWSQDITRSRDRVRAMMK